MSSKICALLLALVAPTFVRAQFIVTSSFYELHGVVDNGHGSAFDNDTFGAWTANPMIASQNDSTAIFMSGIPHSATALTRVHGDYSTTGFDLLANATTGVSGGDPFATPQPRASGVAVLKLDFTLSQSGQFAFFGVGTSSFGAVATLTSTGGGSTAFNYNGSIHTLDLGVGAYEILVRASSASLTSVENSGSEFDGVFTPTFAPTPEPITIGIGIGGIGLFLRRRRKN